MNEAMPQLNDVFLAAKRIQGLVRNTPLIESPALANPGLRDKVFLKLESLQNTGAFKVRGAANKILGLRPEEKNSGVITFSTGNHGKAVSYVAGCTGTKAIVCLSERVPPYRIQAIKTLGGQVVVKGKSQDEAEAHYRALLTERGYIPVVPFDDPSIIAGQGTIALELLSEQPDLDCILVPLSGGGLLAGIAMAAKSINPGIRIIGVSIENSPVMLESLKLGHPVSLPERDTLADSLLGGIGQENHFTLPLIQKYVDEHVLVTEGEVALGMIYALTHHSLVIEGAAAVGIGACLGGKILGHSNRMGIVVTGSAIDPKRYKILLDQYIS
ncbi:MAG: pyridoxal-phosphate dependent enzyme [Spirochaetota bacterium]